MTNRCHVSLPVTDDAGNLASFVIVNILDASTGNFPVGINFYVQETGGNPVVFPLTCRPGVIELWSDTPVRLDIEVTLPTNAIIAYEGVDLAPRSDYIMYAPSALNIRYNDPSRNSVLVASSYGEADFQVIAPAATHQHQGDSAFSVVLTNENATDFSPAQTWVGNHSGENDAFDTTGSVAVGYQSTLGGKYSTIVGNGASKGDFATVISTQGGVGGPNGVVIGADNITSTPNANTDTVVIGSDNTITGSAADYTVLLGSNNSIGSAQGVVLGDGHTETIGSGHTLVGHANGLFYTPSSILVNASQAPYSIGTTAVTANNGSGTDWFGGGSWSPVGYNAPLSVGLIQCDVTTNLLTQVMGSSVIGTQSTTATSTGNVSFFGGTPSARSTQTNYPTDTVDQPIPALNSLMQALNSLGLVRDGIDNVLYLNTAAPAGPVEFADSGQALQWSNPSGSTGYQATNPFVYTGSAVALADQTAVEQFGVFSVGATDTIIRCGMTFDTAATSSQLSGVLIRSYLNLSAGHAAIDGLLIAKSAIYQVSNGVVGSILANYSGSLGTNANFIVKSTGTTITVIDVTNSPSVTLATLTSSYDQTKVKVGFMLSKASKINSFTVSPYYTPGYGYGLYGVGPYGGS